jgi:hypothetical protein
VVAFLVDKVRVKGGRRWGECDLGQMR